MKNTLLLFASIGVFLISGCSDKDPVAPEEVYDFTTIINDYTDKVVIATYLDLKNKTTALQNACEALKNNPTQEKLDAAANAWKTAREPWESSEGFLFGPVSFLSIDPSMDTWPLDEAQLANVLNSNFELTPEFIKDGLGVSLRGYHALEYLLFLNGQNRNISTQSDREREYLLSVAIVLAEDADLLYQEWISGFASEFKKAGNSGSRYGSQNQAVNEMIDGMTTIADEVGKGKIAGPYDSKNVSDVESQFSWNSLTDFENNIRSIKNACTGEYPGQTGVGLNEFVNQKNPELNARVLAEIEATISAINNIPSPFRNNLTADVQIQAAINACNVLFNTLHTDVRALVNE